VLPQGISLPEGTVVSVSLAATTEDPAPPISIGEKLAALGKWAESLPTDLPADFARQHDHYIHGTPKQ
jgi:hypothetical protein